MTRATASSVLIVDFFNCGPFEEAAEETLCRWTTKLGRIKSGECRLRYCDRYLIIVLLQRQTKSLTTFCGTDDSRELEI